MGFVYIEDMEFYAYHGCYQEEKVIGNRFLVNLSMETDMGKASGSDNIEDALNYQVAYRLVKQEMLVTSNLLENVAKRILDALFGQFPQLVRAKVKVSKMNPPMGGSMKCVSVEQERVR